MLYKYVKKEIVRKNPEPRQFNTILKKKENLLSIAFSFSLFVLGGALITYSAFPYIQSRFNKNTDIYKSLLSPSSLANSERRVSSSQVLGTADNQNYRSNVSKNVSTTNKVLNLNEKTHPEYVKITGDFFLSIQKLSFKSIPVKLNVNSLHEDQYMPVLEKSLAHFQGTSIPGKPGNTFVYGHSSNELWARSNPSAPNHAFTALGKLDIGDEIKIKYDNKEYIYTTTKLRLVSPEDISPIYTNSDDQKLTLMTCWPPGIGSDRLIVETKLVEEKEV